MFRYLFLCLAAAVVLTSCGGPLVPAISGGQSSNLPASSRAVAGSFNYGEALQKAIMFYEFQRSGDIDPLTSRNNWRGDSGMSDGADVGKDLTGGWYDAGDHVKFNLPMAYTVSMLSWTVQEYRDALVASGQLNALLDNIKWATDYLIRCHTAPNEFYYQVGDGNLDHSWWGPAEVMQMARPSYKVTLAAPGSAVTGEAAAALAAASMAFADSNPAYSATLLQHARELFTFADTAKSDAGYTAANGFYNSWSGYWDELSWAGAWLYMATGETAYLTKAESYVGNWSVENGTTTIAYTWGQNWDDVHYGAAVLLARLTQNATNRAKYKTSIEQHLEYWRNTITKTPKGLAWLSSWGSLRYATTTAFVANVYSKWSGADQSKVALWNDWAASQVDYALGSTGRSFMIGFGVNPPRHPHHRTAHSSWSDQQTNPADHRHSLVGALVGGPDANDGYTDSISDYVSNEVACDYNAGLVGALTAAYARFGGTPIANLNANETVQGPEFFTQAGVNASGTNFVEIKALLNNISGWPARVSTNLSFRYFINLSELAAAGYSASNVTLSTNYNQGATVTGPFAWDAANNVYYVLINFAGTKIYPGGQSAYKKEVQFRMSYPGSVQWNSTNDWSYQGISTVPGATPVTTANIPVYDGSVKLYGDTPGPVGPSPSPNPSPSTAPSPSPSVAPSPTPSPSIAPSPSPSVAPSPSPSTAPSPSPSAQPGSLRLAYQHGSNSPTGNTIGTTFRLSNSGSTAVNLSQVKIRYYYTKDTGTAQNFWCDFAGGNLNGSWQSITGAVTGTFAVFSPATATADTYLEVGFSSSAGLLGPGGTLEIQTRTARTDWSNYNQNNDYSYLGTGSVFIESPKSVVLVNGTAAWGVQP